jgi:hypothetical protein
MRIRTPLGLFVTIVGVGLIPAAGVGSAIGVSLKDYEPTPTPSVSSEVWENMGASPEPATSPEGRVESVKPTQRATTQVKPTSVRLYKTPHARTEQEQEDVAPKATSDPEPTETPDDRPTAPATKPTPQEDRTKTPDPIKSPPGPHTRTGDAEPGLVAPKNS